MDPETLTALQQQVAREVGVPEDLADRIIGTEIGPMRTDAVQLGRDLGFLEPEPPPQPQARDQAARYASDPIMVKQLRQRHAQRTFTTGQTPAGGVVNDLLRQATGRAPAGPPPPPPVGDLGATRSTRPIFPKPHQRAQPNMSNIIRGTVRARRSTVWDLAEMDAAREEELRR